MSVKKYCEKLVRRGYFPGIALAVGRGDQTLYLQGAGNLTFSPKNPQQKTETAIYDLASLTKPLITAFISLLLFERNELRPKDRADRFFPGFNREITIGRLLTHTSGIPGWYPLYLDSEPCISQLHRLRLVCAPGSRVIYSCLGYILLQFIIEKISGLPLSEFAEQQILAPLSLSSTYFRVPDSMISRCAPTEHGNSYERNLINKLYPQLDFADFPWRTRMIRGEVHDCNAHYLGGGAGNAGLFSTVGDLLILTREFFPETATLLEPDTVRLFWKNQTPGKLGHRSFGFKLNSSLLTSAGRFLEPASIGHNGFTGTSVWLEKDTKNRFIVLTNRVHPQVKTINFNRIRRIIHKKLKKQICRA